MTNWTNEQYEKQRRADDLREAARQAEIKALLTQGKSEGKPNEKKVRRAIGRKLIEVGERLQDNSSLPNPSASKI